MNATPEPSPSPVSRGEIALYLVVCLAFLGVNLVTSSRSPVVWQDEVMFADPAVNLATGRGFTTSAWFQPRTTFFAGNSPLHSLCLAPWVKTFGVNAVAVRSLNYVFVLAALAVTCLALARLGLVNSPANRLLLVALVLCADGVTYSYRGGRYDCLGMLAIAGMLWALTLPTPRDRTAVLVGLAALVPWAGLQLIPYAALLGLLLLVVKGRAAVGGVASVAVGGALGTAALVGLFRAEGVWPEFVKSVALLGGARRPLAARAADALRAPLAEPSSLLLLLALAVLLGFELRRGGLRLRSPVVVGLLAGVVVPCALAFVGKYVRYYAWMSSVPTAVCVASYLGGAGATTAARLAVAPLLLLACAVGLPARLAVTALEWGLRDPAPVDRLVAGRVRPGDWVFSEYEAYYPAKRTAAALFLPPYLGDTSGPPLADPPITAAERDRVNVLITKPDTAAKRLAFFGGPWTPVARYAADPAARVRLLAKVGFGSKPYDLTVYRRRGR